MSDNLLRTILWDRAVHRSPVDDFFSFYYVAQWAAVFNNEEFSSTKREVPQGLSEFRSCLSADRDSYVMRCSVTFDIVFNRRIQNFPEQCGRFLCHSGDLLCEWDEQLRKFRIPKEIVDSDSVGSTNTYKYNPEQSRIITDKLVLETLQLFCRHWSSLY
jgi:hypothetical protein